MLKPVAVSLLLLFISAGINGQSLSRGNIPVHEQSFGIQGGFILLENPFVLYPVINLSYSRTVWVQGRHQFLVMPQAGIILLPGIENKFLFSLSAQYKYVSEKRFEASLFAGMNYQLRQLKYDRYEFDGSGLKNKGNYLHQFGPVAGISAGYKLIKRKKFSISPQVHFSFIKLNKNYANGLLQGYKPFLSFGTNLTTH
jgi:hypothetical protein